MLLERDELKDKVVQMVLNDRVGTPAASEIIRPSKSTKLPDPPILTDGKDPKFEDWVTRVKAKLTVNDDHYPTDDIKRAYVVGRIGGDAASYIAPRLRADSTNPYSSLQDLIQHLTDVYEDPNRVFTAKEDFRKLYMKKTDPFHTFYSNFTRLANEAQVSPTELKYELNHKLTFDLQRQVLREFRDNTYNLKQFADSCAMMHQSLQVIEERQSRTKRTTEKTSKYTSGTPATTTATASASKTYSTTSWAEKQKLQQEGKCFYCKEAGHRAFECPRKKPRTELKAIENGSTESGNDNA